jgi:surface antigen
VTRDIGADKGSSMTFFRFGLSVVLLVGLAACSSTRTGYNTAPMALAPEPAKATAAALQATDIAQFVDAKALGALSEKERTEAASAQFYALQFGRPGAPRLWQGDQGNSGKISVGPYVRVNERDCREFTHDVMTKAGAFHRTGMACRLEGGTWETVADI